MEQCCPRMESPRCLTPRMKSPRTRSLRMKSVANKIPSNKDVEGRWQECGCPLSIAVRAQKVDLTPRQHEHMVALDEAVLHYIFDRPTYEEASEAPKDSVLGKWAASRAKEGRLFVAKPPSKPPSTEPWEYDSPPKLREPLKRGWRAWDPRDVALTYSEWNSVKEYNEHLETFFLWLNIQGTMKSQMMHSGEAWMLACGEDTDHLTVKNRRTCKVNRCFVTNDMDFYELVMAKWDRMSFFPKSIKCGEKMKYMRRIMDIKMDPHLGNLTERGRDSEPCETLCHIHGQYTTRRNIRTAPAASPASKLLHPRQRPRTRAKLLDEKPCTGARWGTWKFIEQGYANWHLGR